MRNIDLRDDQKEPALHKATGGGHKNIAQLLLGKGASTVTVNNDWCILFHFAVRNGHTSMVELLLEKGALINDHVWSCNTPLQTCRTEWSYQLGRTRYFLRRVPGICKLHDIGMLQELVWRSSIHYDHQGCLLKMCTYFMLPSAVHSRQPYVMNQCGYPGL